MKNESALKRRKQRVRWRISQRPNDKPRLSIFRSNRYFYAQIIDDKTSSTLVSASTLEPEIRNSLSSSSSNKQAASSLGSFIAQRALKNNIFSVVFDRGHYPYCGRVAALADQARQAGLIF